MCYEDRYIHVFLGEGCKTDFFHLPYKFPSLLSHSCSNFSNKNKPLLPLLPLFILTQLFFSPDGGQSSGAAACWQHFFQSTQEEFSLCRQNRKWFSFVSVSSGKKKNDLYVNTSNANAWITVRGAACKMFVHCMTFFIRAEDHKIWFCNFVFHFQCRKEKWNRTGGGAQGRKSHTNTTIEDSFTQEQLRHLQRSTTFHLRFGQVTAIHYIQEIKNE